MTKTFSIAIDGPAGAGKSTVAKALASSLGALYLDTGAMYRAFGLAMLRRGVDTHDWPTLAACFDDVDISVECAEAGQRIYLDGEDVTAAIRTPEASQAASDVSTAPEVRRRMVALQQKIAEGHSVVMDGRDIGTAVLPDAPLKIFLTATPEERARRRFLELRQKGAPDTYEQVLRDIQVRDWQDTHREASPLRPAPDAVIVDTSDMGPEESVAALRRLAAERLGL